MPRIDGTLQGPPHTDFAGYRVAATFTTVMRPPGGGAKDPDVLVPGIASTAAGADGAWSLTLPDDGLNGPVDVRASAPSGVTVGDAILDSAHLPAALPITVAAADPLLVVPNPDPARGRGVRLVGRVLDPDGQGVPAGLLVILWGQPPAIGGQPRPPLVPVVAATTTDGGYFGDDWPTGTYDSGSGTVGGTGPIPTPLGSDGRFPRTVVLVSDVPIEVAAHESDEDGCACSSSPPPTPSPADLTAAGGAYSADLGGHRCVDMTTPNRTVEELRFHALVRTTEPEIKGVTLPDPVGIPTGVVGYLRGLALADAVSIGGAGLANTPIRAVAAAADSAAPAGALELPDALHLDATVVADQLHTGLSPAPPTVTTLVRADLLSRLKLIGDLIASGAADVAGRVELDADHLVEWDDHPVTYQATTVAIGHLLTLKQVWRADGYSLGDLLYSLPLAPGQTKQIATVDWDRRETTSREAARSEREQLAAQLSHDRDISEIINSALSEHDRGSSSASVSAVGGGIGGFIGPVVFGGGGGSSDASSEAHSHNTRDVTSSMLDQAQDRTSQGANSVRSQRVTVVQSARQGESLRVQTEVVSNHNHCHAVTMEYFEVLRHFQVSTELADVQECLFVPLALAPFTPTKALRWRTCLGSALSRRDLSAGFDAVARVLEGWAGADVPMGRFADDPLTYLDGELSITLDLPRPADTDTHEFDAGQWGLWAPFLPDTPQNVWNTTMGVVLPEARDQVWNERLAPAIAARIVATFGVALELDGGSATATVTVEATLVTPWRPGAPLMVSLQPDLVTPNVVRSRVTGVTVTVGAVLPLGAKLTVRSGSMHYRTDHLSHDLFDDALIDEELSGGLDVHVPVRLDRAETRNPRDEDRRLATQLVAHLNERVEYYHQAIWREMDPNRRYLLLDGFLAPNAGGRSVASVVENRLIGVVGNCLVLPVVPGTHLDPQWTTPGEEQASLHDAYIVDAPPPRRVSVPTKGVYAEAVMGACNSCEPKDDSRFWRWEESPNPDQPAAIAAINTSSRRTAPPDLSADPFPTPLVGYQQVPDSPDPTGLAAALKLIGTPNLFRDLTGLDLNQQAAAQAFSTALDTAQFFGTQAAGLAQQQFQNKEMDRNLKRIQTAKDQGLITGDQAQTLTQTALRSAAGGGTQTPPPTASPAVRRAIDRASAAPSGSVTVSRPGGTVQVSSGDRTTAGPVSFDVTPAVPAIGQTSPNTCWAAAGAMLRSWQQRSSPPLDIKVVADQLGGGWRQKLDADHALSVAETVSYIGALGLSAEAPMDYLPRGILRLLQQHGPLLVIGDNAIDGDRLVHARIVTGLSGDGTVEGTTVRFIDPKDGASDTEPFTTFTNQIDATDVVDSGLGILHF